MRPRERRHLDDAVAGLREAAEAIDERKYVFIVANSMPEAKEYASLLDPDQYLVEFGSINTPDRVKGHRTDGYFIAPGVDRSSKAMQQIIERLEHNTRIMGHNYRSHEMNHNWKAILTP